MIKMQWKQLCKRLGITDPVDISTGFTTTYKGVMITASQGDVGRYTSNASSNIRMTAWVNDNKGTSYPVNRINDLARILDLLDRGYNLPTIFKVMDDEETTKKLNEIDEKIRSLERQREQLSTKSLLEFYNKNIKCKKD